MTRFDATTEDERRDLFADAIRAHRERESAFLTIEADSAAEPTTAAADTAADPADDPTPWVQYADGTLNLDCTDGELSRLNSVLDSFPAFTVEELTTPEDAGGTNVRVATRADPERVAAFVERVFRAVYERSEGYRAWVTVV